MSERETARDSSSNNAVQLIIPPSETDENAVAIDSATGIEDPANIRSLNDILKYTTQMTDVSTNNGDVIDLTQEEVNDIIEVSDVFVFQLNFISFRKIM